ncbi:ATP-binding protein [Oryzihumus sp.]|jgi:anti-sigma regulatory factor (Ser/Thr protein kinase)|uniref:ATP-binding protein n=1 Tax=Oryzihumus sp. TaxID=1968903 RepID=UPI002ED7E648
MMGTGADGVHERLRLRLPANEAAPRLARRRVTEFCGELGEDIAMAAELLTSELVTNAVIHPRPSATAHSDVAAIVLNLHRTPDRLRVEVIDHDPAPLQPAAGPAEDLSHGWGLQLLDRLATSWGAQSLSVEVGKKVWFEIHAPERG